MLRSNISPAAKLVFAAIAAEMYDRKTAEMTHAEIGACCHIAARHVKRSIKVLVVEGLVEQRRLSAGCVYQYRLLHPEFGSRSNPQQQGAQANVGTPIATPACAKCHLPRPAAVSFRSLPRGCTAEMNLAAHVRAVRAELGPDASPEQITQRMKEIAEGRGRRRLTARVRRD